MHITFQNTKTAYVMSLGLLRKLQIKSGSRMSLEKTHLLILCVDPESFVRGGPTDVGFFFFFF